MSIKAHLKILLKANNLYQNIPSAFEGCEYIYISFISAIALLISDIEEG